MLLSAAKAVSRDQGEGEEGEEKLLAPCHRNRHRHEGSRKTSFWRDRVLHEVLALKEFQAVSPWEAGMAVEQATLQRY